jgi:acyl carrier protein phosphodiesterase
VLEQVLRGISRRLTRPEELAAAMQELRVLYEPLSEDFRLFYPQLQDFAQPVNSMKRSEPARDSGGSVKSLSM